MNTLEIILSVTTAIFFILTIKHRVNLEYWRNKAFDNIIDETELIRSNNRLMIEHSELQTDYLESLNKIKRLNEKALELLGDKK